MMGNSISNILGGSPNLPLVSICLPVFNGEKFLKDAIASILAQSYRNLELLVCDDASTDNSWALLQTIHDPRLILHRNDRNMGPELNWNKILWEAKGKYVKLFHQDDLLDPECIARQVEALEAFPNAVFAFCSRNIIRCDGGRIFSRTVPWSEGLVSADEVFRACVKAGTNIVGEPSSVLFRYDIAKKAGGFDGKIPFLIDLNYWLRLMEYGSAYCIRKPLASFRIGPRQWSAAIGWQQSGQFISFIDPLIKSGCFQLGWSHVVRGRMMARFNSLLRAFIYRLLAGAGNR
jgi:glycosyltransferase involved in cell wall biosynthesis